MTGRVRIVVVGEGMLELSQAASGWSLRYGGDTLNTAVHLARAGFDVAYLTALGDDGFSHDLRAAWAAEGVDIGLVLTDSSRQPGLYAIRVDAAGERSFSYWRSHSAARRMFALDGADAALERARPADLLVFSLISLAVLPPEGRERLCALADGVRGNGGRVAFDGNYRPRLWESVPAAREARDRALACCDIGLPTLEDERALAGARGAEAVAAEWRAKGAGEVAVKLGAEGCLVDGRVVPPPARVVPVDTSGAGDAFNAGYLAARLSGADAAASARSGHSLAAWVIGRAGAIPPTDEAAPYALLASPRESR